MNDLETLSVQKPTVLTKVTDFIPQIISFIDTLLHQDLAYKTSDGSVYFNLNAYSKNYKYGKLKPFQISSPTDGDKSTSSDFALWKAAKSSSEPSWVPTWGGKGRPGWHVTEFFFFIFFTLIIKPLFCQFRLNAQRWQGWTRS